MQAFPSPISSIQVLIQYGAVAALVMVVVAYQTGRIVTGRIHDDIVSRLQKAADDRQAIWRERYDELRADRDKYRDLALQNAYVAARGLDTARLITDMRATELQP